MEKVSILIIVSIFFGLGSTNQLTDCGCPVVIVRKHGLRLSSDSLMRNQISVSLNINATKDGLGYFTNFQNNCSCVKLTPVNDGLKINNELKMWTGSLNINYVANVSLNELYLDAIFYENIVGFRTIHFPLNITSKWTKLSRIITANLQEGVSYLKTKYL